VPPFITAHVRQDEAMLVTIFSASNYGAGGNAGAYMVFSLDPSLLVLPTTDNSFDAEFLQVARAPFNACHHLTLFSPFPHIAFCGHCSASRRGGRCPSPSFYHYFFCYVVLRLWSLLPRPCIDSPKPFFATTLPLHFLFLVLTHPPCLLTPGARV